AVPHALRDYVAAAGRDFQWVPRPSAFFRPAFHVGKELPPRGEARLRSEHRFRRFSRKLAPGFRGACLDNDRPALDRPRDVKRATHRQILSLVVEHMQLVGIEIKALFDIADEGIISPAVPGGGHNIENPARWSVALVMPNMPPHPKIQRRTRMGGGENVPAGAPATEMVE